MVQDNFHLDEMPEAGDDYQDDYEPYNSKTVAEVEADLQAAKARVVKPIPTPRRVDVMPVTLNWDW